MRKTAKVTTQDRNKMIFRQFWGTKFHKQIHYYLIDFRLT